MLRVWPEQCSPAGTGPGSVRMLHFWWMDLHCCVLWLSALYHWSNKLKKIRLHIVMYRQFSGRLEANNWQLRSIYLASVWRSVVAGWFSSPLGLLVCWPGQANLLTREEQEEVRPVVISPARGPAQPPPGDLSRTPPPRPRPRDIKIVWLPVTASITDLTTSCQWRAPELPPLPPTVRASLLLPSPLTTITAEGSLRPATQLWRVSVTTVSSSYPRPRRPSELITSLPPSEGRKRIETGGGCWWKGITHYTE